LDEPLGALDLKLRKAMQLELKQIQADVGITFIYVTHDQEEAMTMSDRIAVMSAGIVQQVGTPREIYEHPTNRFVADFIGETNFVAGSVSDLGDFTRMNVHGISMLGTADGRSLEVGQAVTLAIRPEKINLYPRGKVAISKYGLDTPQFAQSFGDQISSSADIRAYLLTKKNHVVADGRVQEAIYYKL
jgi:spermidine/putrescine transport system ATP-binding protein